MDNPDSPNQNDTPRLAPFDQSHPHLKDFSRFLPELNKESDRGRVLISCSYLDDLLHDILLAFFVPGKESNQLVEGFNAPLESFSTRSTAAFSLGLISETGFRECDTLRRIRNRFAHAVHNSFDNQDVKDLCNNLRMAAPSYGDVIVDARGQYTTSAVALILRWVNRAVYVAKKRRTITEWPA